MPATPPSLPANLHSTLSAIRSSVFLTVHNPTGARIGTKYLQKPLLGKTLVDYYPKKQPKISTLNKQYAQRFAQLEQKYLKHGGDRRALDAWKSMEVAPGYQAAGLAPNAFGVEGLYSDEREDARLRKIARRQKIGKSSPKKGQGKQQQMGKKR